MIVRHGPPITRWSTSSATAEARKHAREHDTGVREILKLNEAGHDADVHNASERMTTEEPLTTALSLLGIAGNLIDEISRTTGEPAVQIIARV
ncbi:hypothetical protein [Promicromonospora sp. NPDC057488]|uniref:hypothetical protein n=1 Tax=Promicromonospora sp. NPDC057488 TaxID=3346147 RepID=UPI00366FDEA4